MEAPKLEYMPYRVKPNQRNTDTAVELATNLYSFTLQESKRIEQYSLETEPAVDDQEISLLRKLVSSQR